MALSALKEVFNDFVNSGEKKLSEQYKQKARSYFSQIYRYKPCFEILWGKIKFISNFNGFMLLI